MSFTAAPYLSSLTHADNGSEAFWLRTSDDIRIRVALLRAQNARGTFLIFPGRTEYIEKYAIQAAFLCSVGFNVVTIDWRGQGLADRLLPDPAIGHVGSFSDYQRDIDAVLEWIGDLGLERPLYLLAHSMGGCIALRRLIQADDISAVIFSGPMWGIYFHPALKPFVDAITYIGTRFGLANSYAPSTSSKAYVLETAFKDNKLTTNADEWAVMQQHVTACPDLILGGPSWHWLRQARQEMAWLAHQPSPNIPCYCLLGDAEEIVSPHQIRDRMSSWRGGHLHVVAGGRHETLMEGRGRVAQLMTQALIQLNLMPEPLDQASQI